MNYQPKGCARMIWTRWKFVEHRPKGFGRLLTALAVAMAVPVALPASPAFAQDRPNIVVIFGDDIGQDNGKRSTIYIWFSVQLIRLALAMQLTRLMPAIIGYFALSEGSSENPARCIVLRT